MSGCQSRVPSAASPDAAARRRRRTMSSAKTDGDRAFALTDEGRNLDVHPPRGCGVLEHDAVAAAPLAPQGVQGRDVVLVRGAGARADHVEQRVASVRAHAPADLDSAAAETAR